MDPLFQSKPWMSSYHAFSDNPIMNSDPSGAYDGWYTGEDNTLQFDSRVHSQADLSRYGLSGTYQGETVSGTDTHGKQFYADNNGNISFTLPTAKVNYQYDGPDWAKQVIDWYQNDYNTMLSQPIGPFKWTGPGNACIAVEVNASLGGYMMQGSGAVGIYIDNYGVRLYFTEAGGVGGHGAGFGLSLNMYHLEYTGPGPVPQPDKYLGGPELQQQVDVGVFNVGTSQDTDIKHIRSYSSVKGYNAYGGGLNLLPSEWATDYGAETNLGYTHVLGGFDTKIRLIDAQRANVR